MNLSIISFSAKGDKLNSRLCDFFINKGDNVNSTLRTSRKLSLGKWTETAFSNSDGIIFIGAVGIAVRAISPFLKGKDKDPAVVVCDELGQYAIPVLSGHIGGANKLADNISSFIGSRAVITTATDINNVFSVDTWAVEKGYKIYNKEEIKFVSSYLLENKKIGIVSDIDVEPLPENVVAGNGFEVGIVISPFVKKPFKHTLNLIPRCVYIGVGSKKNSDRNALVALFNKVICKYNIAKESIAGVATIDIKSNEISVLELCIYLGIEPKFYTSDELNTLEGNFTASDFVKSVTGTDNVCERSALMATKGGNIIVKKQAENGVTIAFACNLEVTK